MPWAEGTKTKKDDKGTQRSLLIANHAPVLSGQASSAVGLWQALRPRQWVKNFVVLTPVLFSRNLLNSAPLSRELLAFGLFCCVSSSVYLLNDIADREEDRFHPLKCCRPIASGRLGVVWAWAAMIILLGFGVTAGFGMSRTFGAILGGYWLLNLLYSTVLKKTVILDVFGIALGFVFRAAGGAAAIQVEMSEWLLVCTMLLALFLGFSKRRHELVLLGEKATSHRQVLSQYNTRFLDMMIGIVTASTVMSYANYTASAETIARFHSRGLIITLPFVVYGIFRYLYLVYHKADGGDPSESLLGDWPTWINLALWVLTIGAVIYVQ